MFDFLLKVSVITDKVLNLHMKIQIYGRKHIDNIEQLKSLSEEERNNIKLAAHILPFRTNNYVIEELIDWNAAPNDPIFHLTFPQKEMLHKQHYLRLKNTLSNPYSTSNDIESTINSIRIELNPHPANQLTDNVPTMNGVSVQGVQHKYRETALIFPSPGQTCHAYCTYCFRWPQFTGMDKLKFTTDKEKTYFEYLANNQEITDVLFTGGDPLFMTADKLAAFIDPILSSKFEHIKNIRIGSKALAYWPYRFISDKDADKLLYLFERINKSGKKLAFMSHFIHQRELETPAVKKAIDRIQTTNTIIRCQAPILKHINDDHRIWQQMWKEEVEQGLLPYYMFVARDTGAKKYFSVPLVVALKIFQKAFQNISGLGRSVQGPVMSTAAGKVCIRGVSEIKGEKVFVLNFLQSRNPRWIEETFYAKYDENATWFTDLKPALGTSSLFPT